MGDHMTPGLHFQYGTWIRLHQAQLEHFGMPPTLWHALWEKLHHGVWDFEEGVQLEHGRVSARQDLAPASSIWPVKHMLRTTRGSEILSQLKDDPALLLRVADAMQLLDGSSSEEEEEEEEQPEDPASLLSLSSDGPFSCSDSAASVATSSSAAVTATDATDSCCDTIYGSLYVRVAQELHKHVFMFEANMAGDRGTRMRYMLEPLATRLAVSAQPELEVAPFVQLTCTGFDGKTSQPLGVRVLQVFSVAWPVRAVPAGAALSRGKLPLGLADYSKQEFWAETYRGTTDTEEWYCGYAEEVQALLHKHCPATHALATANAGSRGSSANQADTAAGMSQPSQLGGVLVAGCGNSTFGVELWQAGHRPVVNADYIEEVVRHMDSQYPATTYPGMSWVAANLTTMAGSPLAGMHFHAVVDKATLDALMTADAADVSRWRAADHGKQMATVGAYLSTLAQLMTPVTGVLVLVTLRAPHALQSILDAVNQRAELGATEAAGLEAAQGAAVGKDEASPAAGPFAGDVTQVAVATKLVQLEARLAGVSLAGDITSSTAPEGSTVSIRDAGEGGDALAQIPVNTDVHSTAASSKAVQASAAARPCWHIVEHQAMPSASAHVYVCKFT